MNINKKLKVHVVYTDQYQVSIHYKHPETESIKVYLSKAINVPYFSTESRKTNHEVATAIAIRDLMLELNVAAMLEYELIEVSYL